MMNDPSEHDRSITPFVPLPNQKGKTPLAVSYTDKHRSLSILYPHPAPQQPPQKIVDVSSESEETPRYSQLNVHLQALLAATVVVMICFGLSLVAVTIGTVVEALNQPEVIIHE